VTHVLWTPPPPLDAFVEKLWYWQAPAAPVGERQTAMATGAMGLIVPLGGNEMSWWNGPDDSVHHRHRGIALIGVYTARVALDASQLGEVIGISLRPGAAPALFRPAADEFRDGHAPLEDVWGPEARELHEQVQEARTVREKFDRLANALRAHLRTPLPLDRAISHALGAIAAAPHEAVVQRFADAAGLRAKTFSARFSAQVGMTPKLYARIERFRRAFAQAPGRAVSWAQLAADCGYYDQAHLIRDFRAFTGLSPTEYERLRGPQPEHVALPPREIRTSQAT
jgi:AraC-like DNA-binding protein